MCYLLTCGVGNFMMTDPEIEDVISETLSKMIVVLSPDTNKILDNVWVDEHKSNSENEASVLYKLCEYMVDGLVDKEGLPMVFGVKPDIGAFIKYGDRGLKLYENLCDYIKQKDLNFIDGTLLGYYDFKIFDINEEFTYDTKISPDKLTSLVRSEIERKNGDFYVELLETDVVPLSWIP